MAPKYPCGTCGNGCGLNSIGCDQCDNWIHRRCVPGLDKTALEAWAEKGMTFLCANCCFKGTEYDIEAALARLSLACKTPSKLKVAVRNESLLLATYQVALPPRQSFPITGSRDVIATGILEKFQPALLEDHVPMEIVGDGNCFFRTISRGLYGHENHHVLLRLLTALQVAEFPPYYDNKRCGYCDLIKDSRLPMHTYGDILSRDCTLGAYIAIEHFFALKLC